MLTSEMGYERRTDVDRVIDGGVGVRRPLSGLAGLFAAPSLGERPLTFLDTIARLAEDKANTLRGQ